MQKTLGGDRIGSGKKMKVELHNYGRSSHDLGYIWRNTQSAGTLVPFISEVALPGDDHDIDLHLDIKTLPTTGPLFGSFKAQLDIYLCPIRLYQGQLHNNKLGVGMKMSNVKLPQMSLYATVVDPTRIGEAGFDIDNAQINPSNVLNYLGWKGVGMRKIDDPVTTRTFNALSWLMYWDIYKNYYANKQEEIGAVIHTVPKVEEHNVDDVSINGVSLPTPPASPAASPLGLNSEIVVSYTGTQDLTQVLIRLDNGLVLPVTEIGILVSNVAGVATFSYKWAAYGDRVADQWTYESETDTLKTEINIATFNLSEIDDMRENILAHATQSTPFDVNAQNLYPYRYMFERNTGYTALMGNQEGLGLKTYNSDLFNNWLSTEWIDGAGGISEVTSIDTSGGSFSIDTLLISKKVYDMLNRVMVSGGSYDDWLDVQYMHDRYVRSESPMYMGGMQQELVFQEVVSNSESGGGQQGGILPLGSLAGKGILAKNQKGGQITIKTDEPSYIIGLVSLTPRLDYSQGNSWDIHLQTMDDLRKPALDEIGFQELITEQMAWWDTFQTPDGVWTQLSAGKQPAWINYMTNVNRVRGNFAVPTDSMYMVLTRRYEPEFVADKVTIKDLTTYVDPRKFNHIFAQTSLDSQNFWVQIGVQMTARRKMSAKIMPNL